jgi:homoserine acetyltransferase
MSKKHQLSQPSQRNTVNENVSRSEITARSNSPSSRIQPEQISLDAHQHIQKYLKDNHKQFLDKEDLNAVLRLSQHLRVFGLLSAVGYINQSNAQEGKVRERTVPVWKLLLNQLVEPEKPLTSKELMEKVVEISKQSPSKYMTTWRKSLLMANHCNFWARAYSE